MHPPQHILAVMGLVRNPENKILLIKSPRRGWEPPGGQVENGEDLPTALRREVQEESGVEVEVQELLAIYSNLANDPTSKVMFTFSAIPLTNTLVTSPESTEVGWFTEEEALAMVVFPTNKIKLEDALSAQKRKRPALVYRTYQTSPFELLMTWQV